MFYTYLAGFSDQFILFNLFKYITFRTFAALLTSMAIYFLVGPFIMRKIHDRKWHQVIREDGPQSHLIKKGTPTMGGLVILSATLLSSLLWVDLHNSHFWLLAFLMIAYGFIGYLDDSRKIKRGSSAGLPGRYKMLFQVLVATLIAFLLFSTFDISSKLSVPFFKNFQPDLGWAYVPFAIFVIVGSSNAVNLTDGLDGLATVPLITSFGTFGLFAYVAGHAVIASYLQIPNLPGAGELSVVSGAVIGALLGFLWFNSYPAEVFMGDVGSLPLGGLLGLLALMTKNEILLVLVGGIFVLETVSVITQVLSFQTTGRRIFRMAPLHHHFELKGWNEAKISVRFWIISFLLSLLALATLKLR